MLAMPPSSRDGACYRWATSEPLGTELLLAQALAAELKSPVLSLHDPRSSFSVCTSFFSFPAPPIPVLPIFLPIWGSPTLPL